MFSNLFSPMLHPCQKCGGACSLVADSLVGAPDGWLCKVCNHLEPHAPVDLEREAEEAGTPAQVKTVSGAQYEVLRAVKQARELAKSLGFDPRQTSELEGVVHAAVELFQAHDNGPTPPHTDYHHQSEDEARKAVLLAVKQAGELGRDIGMVPDDIEGLQREVRRSALELEVLKANPNATPAELDLVLEAEVDSMIAAYDAEVQPSVLDQLAGALREGAILTMGAQINNGPVHAILETDDGGRFTEGKGHDVLAVLTVLVELWKHAGPKPPPLCNFCQRPLEGVLVGQHLNVGHSVPICLGFSSERTRNSCVPPDAIQRLLAAELRKRNEVKA